MTCLISHLKFWRAGWLLLRIDRPPPKNAKRPLGRQIVVFALNNPPFQPIPKAWKQSLFSKIEQHDFSQVSSVLSEDWIIDFWYQVTVVTGYFCQIPSFSRRSHAGSKLPAAAHRRGRVHLIADQSFAQAWVVWLRQLGADAWGGTVETAASLK